MFADMDHDLKELPNHRITELERRIEPTVATDVELTETVAILRSVPGTGPVAGPVAGAIRLRNTVARQDPLQTPSRPELRDRSVRPATMAGELSKTPRGS